MLPNSKRILFRVSSLILLSLLAVIFSFFFLWSLNVDSKTLAEKAATSAEGAIYSGVALIFLVWFGAALDFLISLIPKRNIRILAAFLVYLFVPGLCCIVFPALMILLFSGVLVDGWNEDTGFGVGILGVIAFIPAAVGFVFVYLGAGVASASRWLAGRIWREPVEIPALHSEAPS